MSDDILKSEQVTAVIDSKLFNQYGNCAGAPPDPLKVLKGMEDLPEPVKVDGSIREPVTELGREINRGKANHALKRTVRKFTQVLPEGFGGVVIVATPDGQVLMSHEMDMKALAVVLSKLTEKVVSEIGGPVIENGG